MSETTCWAHPDQPGYTVTPGGGRPVVVCAQCDPTEK